MHALDVTTPQGLNQCYQVAQAPLGGANAMVTRHGKPPPSDQLGYEQQLT